MRFPKSNPEVLNFFSKIKELSSGCKWRELVSHFNEFRKGEGFQFRDPSIFHPILKACLSFSIPHGKSIHGTIIKLGFEPFTSTGNSVMDFYAKSGALTSAMRVFDAMKLRDSVSWNIIIYGHLDRGAVGQGLELFVRAREFGFEPNVSTLVLVLNAYRDLGVFNGGLEFHGYLIRSGFCRVISVQNSLLSFYVEVGIAFARKLFDEMCERDVISWSIMIGGYAHWDERLLALEFFKHMMSEDAIEADGQTMVSVVKACADLGDRAMGKAIHGLVICRGLDYDLFVGNSLVDLYCKCCDIDSASKVFSEMPRRNTISWNSLLSGLVHSKKYSEALNLFALMANTGVDADEVTIVNLLQICKYLGDLPHCGLIHSRIIQKGFESNELVMNSLIDSYAKCNQITQAWRLFCQTKRRDAVTWSTMIAGFTHCGMPNEAISVYRKMFLSREKPNHVSLLNLLDACSLSAELRTAKWAHGIAVRMGLASDVTIGTAILDMYSKCGTIIASRTAFDEIGQKNVVSWSAMIAAYGMNGLPHDALDLLSEMITQGLKPNPVTMLSVLSACAHGGLIKEGLSLFNEFVENHDIELTPEHYSCLVDLLARAGNVGNALDVIKWISSEMKPGASAWGALLSACRNYDHIELGRGAVCNVLELEPSSSAGYLLASSMYAAGGSWLNASKMRCLVKERGVDVIPGYSLVYVDD